MKTFLRSDRFRLKSSEIFVLLYWENKQAHATTHELHSRENLVLGKIMTMRIWVTLISPTKLYQFFVI